MRVLWLALGVLALLAAAPAAASSSSSPRRALFAGDLFEAMGLDSAEINQRAMEKYSGYSTSQHTPRLALSVAASECADCVCSVGHHVLEEALNAVADACKNVTCPFFKEKCAWLEKHPGELSGYLAVTVRPFTDGYMYCMGNASCEHPSSDMAALSDALLVADSVAQPDLLLPQLAAAARFIPQALRGADRQEPAPTELAAPESGVQRLAGEARAGFLKLSTLAHRLGALERAEERDDGERPTDAADSEADSGAKKKRSKCAKCLRRSVKWQLRTATRALQEACEATKCPHFQKFCEWAEKHPHVTRGMIYGRLQPYKAAAGYCAGNKKCKYDDKDEAEEKATGAAAVSSGTVGVAAAAVGQPSEAQAVPAVQPTVLPAYPGKLARRPAFGRGKHDRVPHKKPKH